jgi:putative addiction module component (TIGR02574 family)
MPLTLDQQTLDQLEEKLLSLPESSRDRLAMSLLDSLPAPDGILDEDSPELEAELARRCAGIEDGTAVMVPFETVMQELRELLQQG